MKTKDIFSSYAITWEQSQWYNITVRYLVRNVHLPATNLMDNTIGIVKHREDVYANLSGLEKWTWDMLRAIAVITPQTTYKKLERGEPARFSIVIVISFHKHPQVKTVTWTMACSQLIKKSILLSNKVLGFKSWLYKKLINFKTWWLRERIKKQKP